MNDPRILPPIPTPPAQRWREVRLLYLPRVMFVIGAAVAALLWSRSVAPATLVAEAEGIQAEVRTSQAGVLSGLNVALLQPVRAGEVVGHVVSANPRLLDATLSVIRAEVGMLTASWQGATDRQRVALAYERMQLDWMSRRVDLVALRGQLQQAESDFARAGPLQKAGLITEQDFEKIKITRDSLVAQIAEQTALVAHLEPSVRAFGSADRMTAEMSPDSALAAGIKVQDAKLKLAEEQLTPAPLVAPIDGVVSVVLRRSGETVAAGDAVLRISATRPERLIGFLRQPMPFEPKVGMTAEIRTRGAPRKIATTRIVQVGSTMEAITPTVLAAMRLPATPTPEPALRIHLALPDGLTLLPGEHVDVIVR